MVDSSNHETEESEGAAAAEVTAVPEAAAVPLAIAELAARAEETEEAKGAAEEAAAEPVRRLEPFAAAIARGAEARERLVEQAGGLLSAEAAGRLLGITRAALDEGEQAAFRARLQQVLAIQ